MAIPIISVDPSVVSLQGGTVITVTGTFPAGDLAVYIGPNGDDTDEQCYSGDHGSGYVITRTDASTLSCVTPPLARGLNDVSVYSTVDNGSLADAITVIEQTHLDSVFEQRKNWPQWVDTGPRELELEDRQDVAAGYSGEFQSVIRSLISTVGAAMAEIGGYRITRLRSPALIGDTELSVESTDDFETSGTLYLEDEIEPIPYTGVVQTPGGQQFTGVTGISIDHREESEIVEANRQFSKLDLLRRALLVAYADGEDLARIGRRHGVDKPNGFSDDIFRNLIQVIAYLERGPIYSLELVLDALFPTGGWSVYESLIEDPLKVFIRVPGAIGDDPAGRCFMMSRDQINSATALTAGLSNTPISIESVKTQNVFIEVGMTVLPSAEAIPWTFQPELVGAEGAYFAVVAGSGVQQLAGGAVDNGRYFRTIPELSDDFNRIDAAWRWVGLTVINQYPWKLVISDGDKEYCLMWDQTDAFLGQSDGTAVSAAYTFPLPLTNAWQYPSLILDNDVVKAYWNKQEILSEPRTSFAASALRQASFGYFATGLAQRWDTLWGWINVYTKDNYNWLNLNRGDGVLNIGVALLNSGSNPFIASHVGKYVRFNATNDENNEIWIIDSFAAANQVGFDGIVRNGYASALTSDRLYSHDPIFNDASASKSVIITSGLNAGTYAVASVISEKELQLTGASFVTELETPWKYNPNGVVNEGGMPFEIIDAGAMVSPTLLLLPDPLPAAITAIEIIYTTVLSGQVLRNETIENTGTDYWPFYITGTNERIQKIIDEVTVAGVFPQYDVVYR